jgi:hypothetical protein
MGEPATKGKAMKQRYWAVACFSVFFLVSCASTELARKWSDESRAGSPIQKMLVVGVSENLANRTAFEDHFQKRLQQAGVEAVASYKVMISGKQLQKELVLEQADKLGTDAILVTQLIGVEEKVFHYEGSGKKTPTQQFGSFASGLSLRGYRRSGVSYTKMESVRLVTNIYDRAEEKLIWSAVSETMKPENVKEIADSLASSVIRSLRDDGWIP